MADGRVSLVRAVSFPLESAVHAGSERSDSTPPEVPREQGTSQTRLNSEVWSWAVPKVERQRPRRTNREA